MDVKDIIFPDCSLCRTLRAGICAGLMVVLATYAAQLIIINVEMNLKAKEAHHGL